MKHLDLLLSSISDETLDSLVAKISYIADINEFEERFSSHYVDERYFIAHSKDFQFKIMLCDDEDHSDRPFWIRLRALGADAELNESAIHESIVRAFLNAGLAVSKIENFGLAEERRIDY